MGFEIVTQHLELILIPILLDAALWLGPRLSLAPLLQKLEQWFALASVELAEINTMASPVELDYVRMTAQGIFKELAQRFNLFILLGPLPPLWTPSLMKDTYMSLQCAAGVCADTADLTLLSRPEFTISSLGMLIVWSLLLLFIGLGVSAFYLRMIGVRVIEVLEVEMPSSLSVGQVWQQLTLFVGAILLTILAWFGFIFFCVGCVALGSLQLGEIVASTLMAFGVFNMLHLIFAVPSIVQQHRTPWQAMRDSFILTRGDFFNVIALFALTVVIWQGFNYVWSRPDPATWQMWVGISGHAFISTALMTALFIFYQERLCFVESFIKALATRKVPALKAEG